jgi:hypothetical protein
MKSQNKTQETKPWLVTMKQLLAEMNSKAEFIFTASSVIMKM